jgi:putative copper resistance protein D
MNGAPLDTLLFAMRSLHFAATILTAGLVVFRQVVVASYFADPNFDRTLSRIFTASTVVLVASGVGWFTVTAAAIADQPIKDIFAGPLTREVLLDTQFGQVSLLRLGTALALSICVVAGRGRWLSVALAVVLLATLAWLGHSGAAPSMFFTGADALHVTAAGVWLGGLVPLALLLASLRRQKDAESISVASRVTRRFSLLGIAMVTTILITGLINTWNLVGSVEGLLDTAYGGLLLVKIALFLAMISVAAVNRFRLSPRLQVPGTLKLLERNSLIEAALGLLILLIVGALGTMPPALHSHMEHMH